MALLGTKKNDSEEVRKVSQDMKKCHIHCAGTSALLRNDFSTSDFSDAKFKVL